MSNDSDTPSPQPTSLPALGAYVMDTRTRRLGAVIADEGGALYLRPPGGGTEWCAEAAHLRPPTEAEWGTIRMLTTPVAAVER
ncbi:hypothetical protein ACFVJI_04565 [Streptomyces sp. NPDC127584]|uniref:hypothetical protein n=1 Tax=Streptomyces sp. NPDC127584 TaxID=3345403 RepID=UPI0036302B0B